MLGCALALSPTRTTDAQSPGQSPAVLGQVRGTVYDSVAGRPLAAASVVLGGSVRMTWTGPDGRFVFDSVPAGSQRFEASHPALDSMGVPALVATILVQPPAVADVRLATLGRERVLAALCGAGGQTVSVAGRARGSADAAPGPMSGVVFGAVTDAATGARLAGAVVSVRYITTAGVAGTSGDAAALVRDETVVAHADSVGEYVRCGLPVDAELQVRAHAGASQSGAALLTLGGRPVARVDLSLATAPAPGRRAESPAATPAETRALPLPQPLPQALPRADLRGVVRDTAGVPTPYARVRVADLPDVEVLADAHGRFVVPGVPLGTQTLLVRAVGYAPQAAAVQHRHDPDAAVDVVLRRLTSLGAVTVRARADVHASLRRDIAERQRVGMGHWLDSAAVQRAGSLRNAMVTLPFINVTGSMVLWDVRMWSGPTVLSAGRPSSTCAPAWWLDGVAQRDNETITGLPPEHILAVEVFRRANLVPMQYRTDQTLCGAVFVWTHAGL
jgi:hypothetical protein